MVNITEEHRDLLTKNAIEEADIDGYDGMKAVTTVVINRLKSDRYPSNVPDVVLQHKQFSWTLEPHKLARPYDYYNPEIWDTARSAVNQAIAESCWTSLSTGARDATLYAKIEWVLDGKVEWAKSDKVTVIAIIGSHMFFKEIR